MAKWLKRSFLILIALAGVIQLARPERSNPSSDPSEHIGAVLPVHPEVAGVFSRACNDCHSNDTMWPWYSNVAPASWLLAKDVQEGRREMNFSTWRSYQGEKQQELLGDICKEVNSGEMPGPAYTLAHPKARLTQAERAAVCAWTTSIVPSMTVERGEEEGD
jgi:heme-binding protein